MEPILKIENLKTSFMTSGGEVQAVRGVSFSVGKGEILGIVGESGSGKSVTSMSILRLLADTARIKDGSILFESADSGGKTGVGDDPGTSSRQEQGGTEKRGDGAFLQSPYTGTGKTVPLISS